MTHPTNQDSEHQLDAILSEYFTWKGEAIHLVNQTENYQRMKAAILFLIIDSRIDALTEFAPPVDERRSADSFHGDIYVTKVSRIDNRIEELEKQKKELE